MLCRFMTQISKFLLAASFSLLMAGSATAQIVVHGSGAARDCYITTKAGNKGSIGAIQSCREALTDLNLTRKHEAATHVNLGILLMRKGDYEDSLKNYARALDIRPTLSQIYINRAAAQIHMGNYQAALDDANKAIEMGTDQMPEALFNRAVSYDRLEDYTSAYKDLKQVLVLRPEWKPAEALISGYVVTSNAPTN